MILGIIIGAIAMAVLSALPVLGPILAGFIAGLIAGGGLKRGILSGFLSGTIGGIIVAILITTIGGLLGSILAGPPGAALGGILGSVLGAGVFVSTLYFGFLGLVGGVLGGLLRPAKKKRRLVMKAKWMSLLAGVVVLVMILLTGYQPVVAAPPTGEVKTVAPMFGNEIPIPYLEMSHANDWMQLLYDHLVGCTPEGKFSPDLGLANKWEMSPDGLTWTFYLRKGVKFHDGVELTAKDVKFSIEQFMLPDSVSDQRSLY